MWLVDFPKKQSTADLLQDMCGCLSPSNITTQIPKKYFKLYSLKVNGNEPNNWPIEQELDGHNSWPLDQNAGHTPQLWSCCLRSRGAGGRLPRWTELTGTGAATSGSPLAAPDLSTQTPCRETKHRGWVIPSAPEKSESVIPQIQTFRSKIFSSPSSWMTSFHSLDLLTTFPYWTVKHNSIINSRLGHELDWKHWYLNSAGFQITHL